MSRPNNARPHLLVLPEDDANRQIALGFNLHPSLNGRAFQILPVAGGWRKVLEAFRDDEVAGLQRFPERHLALLIDLDNHLERVEYVKGSIPQRLADRVFVLSTLDEPERLGKGGSGGLQAVGTAMADDCVKKSNSTWNHPLLAHNVGEVHRMMGAVRDFLFERRK